jgi:DNA replication protein DnaC
MNVSLKELYNEKKETREVFRQFSKYINLYMKSKMNFDNNPEEQFYKEKDFIINEDDSLDFYSSNDDGRTQMTLKLEFAVDSGLNYFITGPHGIGKTFTLLGFLSILSKIEKFRYIYINLDILNKQKNKMEILLYEAKNLFKSEKDYISACEYLKDKLIIPGLEFPLIEIFNQKLILKLDNYLFILGINLCNLKKNNFYRGN